MFALTHQRVWRYLRPPTACSVGAHLEANVLRRLHGLQCGFGARQAGLAESWLKLWNVQSRDVTHLSARRRRRSTVCATRLRTEAALEPAAEPLEPDAGAVLEMC